MASKSANEDEEKLRRIEQDRSEINAAYDNGYSNDSLEEEGHKGGARSIGGLNINDLQDKIDRYGFIHSEKLPPKLTEVEIRRNNVEKLREAKWLEMLKNWSAYSNQSNSKYLKSRVFKGIPNSTRNIAWYKLLDVESQIKAQSGVYERMKFLARKYSVDLRQIDLDINRTFRDNLAYKKRYCQRQVQLYNVLAAYSIYNTEIGYCQGMSNIAALLLMYLSDEERTFWALSQLMSSPKYSMHGFFKKDFPKLIRFSDKHDAIIKELMPKLYKKFIKCNITSLLYTTKWFLQCYLDALPFSLVLRIWDVYLLKGEVVLLGMSYCILKMHKKFLVKKDMDEINEYLKNKLPGNFMFDDDIAMQKLESCIETLRRSRFTPLEEIPMKELPSQPFGTFKATSKQEMVVKSAEKSSNESRLAELEKMASVRLEVEKKRQREERKRRKQERLAAATATTGATSFGAFIDDGGKPIKNISDEDDEEESESDDEEDEDEEDEQDDLNPSKLSDYEDERGDKASILSDLTHQTSSHRSSADLHQSQSSLDARHRASKAASFKNSTNSFAAARPGTSERASKARSQPRDDDFLMKNPRNDNDYTVNLNHLSAHNSPVKFLPKGSRDKEASLGSLATSASAAAAASAVEPGDDRFGKVTAKPLGQMAPQPSANINRTTSMAFTSPTARVMSNPPPVSPTPPMVEHVVGRVGSLNSNASSHSIFTNGYEYVRSPHGIYTRVNQLSVQQQSRQAPGLNAKLIQHSASNIQIAQPNGAAAVSAVLPTPIPISTKRTSSLRNVQPRTTPHYSHHHHHHQHNAQQAPAPAATPTKQQLHNHSLRIASIQQQQQQQQQQQGTMPATANQSYSSISIISQAPKTTPTPTTAASFQQSISPNYYRSSSSSHVPSSPAPAPSASSKSIADRVSAKFKNLSSDIEQYDYI